MELKVLLPTHVAVNETVRKVNAEGTHGAFCLLPRHVDFVAELVPGLLSFESQFGAETFLAVDGGLLVKCGEKVLVSTTRAARGSLGQVTQEVEKSFRQRTERETQARAALEKIQADFIRRFVELQVHG